MSCGWRAGQDCLKYVEGSRTCSKGSRIFWGDWLSTLTWIFSRRSRRLRRRIQQAVLFRREIRLDYWSYWGLFGDWLSTLTWIFSRRWRWLRRGIQHGCIISQRKTGWSWCGFEVLLFWGFICVNLRDLRETLGFLLSTLACLFSRRWRRSRRRIQQAALFRRERQIGIRVVWGFVCVNLRDTFWGLFANCLSTLAWIFSRRLRRSRRGIQQAVLLRRERQIVCG